MSIRQIRKIVASFFACGFLLGCATPQPGDSDSIDVSDGYAVINVHYSTGGLPFGEVDIEVKRAELDGPGPGTYMSGVLTGRPTLVRLKPGFYYLSSLISGSGYGNLHRRETYKPLTTLFEVKSGQLSYPGDWIITTDLIQSSTFGTIADGQSKATYRMAQAVYDNPDTYNKTKLLFPKLAARLTMVYTRIKKNEESK